LVVSESAGSLSSVFLHQALLHRLIHSNNPAEHIATFRDRLHHWAGITEKILTSAQSDTVALQSFLAETRAEMGEHLAATEAEQYSFTAGLPLSFLGLARHIRKRGSTTD
jgi:hypothetical protein